MSEPSKRLEESMLQILLPNTPTVGVFCTSKQQGLQDCVFPVLMWSREQLTQEFILV
jgi:hypothetical protein